MGGISKFAPLRQDLLARDGICAASKRLRIALAIETACTDAALAERQQQSQLLPQARKAARKALNAGELSLREWNTVDQLIIGSLNTPSRPADEEQVRLDQACQYLRELAGATPSY